jgi:transposase
MTYKDPGATHYEERYRNRVLGNLKRRAKSFGYDLQELPPEADMAVS